MKNEIKELVFSIIEMTKNGELKWSTNDDSNYERKFIARSGIMGSTDLTIFTLDIKYKLINNQLTIDSKPGLFIRNDNLPDKTIYVYGDDYIEELVELRDLVKDIYASDMNPTTNDISTTIRKINFNLSGSIFRDKRINDILNEE
jgi:hypothetical protein